MNVVFMGIVIIGVILIWIRIGIIVVNFGMFVVCILKVINGVILVK